jgi:WD domain, G-beta repeat
MAEQKLVLAETEMTIPAATKPENRRNLSSLIGTGVAVLIAAIAGVTADQAQRNAQTQRTIASLEREAAGALKQFEFAQFEALMTAMKAGQKLHSVLPTIDVQDSTSSPQLTLQTLLTNIQGRPLYGHQGLVWKVIYSPDGKSLGTTGADYTARVWNLQGQQIALLEGHQGGVMSVVYSPDGKSLATSGEDNTARVWNLQGQQIALLKGHQGGVRSIVYSPDGKSLATSSEDGTARVWNLQGQQITLLKGHQGNVTRVVYSPDGKSLGTTGKDGTARVWNLQRQQIAEFQEKDARVTDLSFAPDSATIAIATSNGTVRMYPVETLEQLLHRGCAWAESYLVNHARELQELPICQEPNRLKIAAANLITQSEELARKGDIDKAIDRPPPARTQPSPNPSDVATKIPGAATLGDSFARHRRSTPSVPNWLRLLAGFRLGRDGVFEYIPWRGDCPSDRAPDSLAPALGYSATARLTTQT